MIELAPTTALMIYLGMTLCIILFIWGYTHYRSGKKKIFTSEKKLYVCEYCHFPYLGEADDPVTSCPQCHLYNKR